MRLELTHRNRHYPLKVACLPISPSAQINMREKMYCAQNRTRTCTALRPLVPETSVSTNFTIWAIVLAQKFFEKKSETSSFALTLSEKRDSNPRPRPWQGRALPTELLSQFLFQLLIVIINHQLNASLSKRVQRYVQFLNFRNFSTEKNKDFRIIY